MSKNFKLFAYFLPQFHECPYNNKWWGQGFTEWVNVNAALPLRFNHYQPRSPMKGQYDIMNDGVIEEQFENAQLHGIDSFIFYHYWYSGETPLGKPIQKIIQQKNSKVDFCLCWANHSWTRSWKNRRGALDVLIEQKYENTREGRIQHFKYLADIFVDNRYRKLNGKPFFEIYIPEQIPDLNLYIEEFRTYLWQSYKIEMHIAATLRNLRTSYSYLNNFDSVTLRQPTLSLFSPEKLFGGKKINSSVVQRFRSLSNNLPLGLKKILYLYQDTFANKAMYFDYDKTWIKLLSQTKNAISELDIPINSSAFTDFDNTPRYGKNARIIEGFTPEKFQKYFSMLLDIESKRDDRIILINAWNEWGEGMYLEADNKYGDNRLIAIKNSIHNYR